MALLTAKRAFMLLEDVIFQLAETSTIHGLSINGTEYFVPGG